MLSIVRRTNWGAEPSERSTGLAGGGTKRCSPLKYTTGTCLSRISIKRNLLYIASLPNRTVNDLQ